MSSLLWHQGIIKEIIVETPITRRFILELPELEAFPFLPGQFVTLDLPIGEKNSERWRSYSIASAPDGNCLELIIVHANGGKGTDFLFDHCPIDSPLKLRGPQGKFILPPVLDKPLYMVCTGTGIAPFRSMIRHVIHRSIPHQGINLIFGCRKKTDLLYFEEMQTLAAADQGFRYIPTLSRDSWEGRTGYVHQVYMELLKDAHPAYIYLCGWKNMINEARENLESMGYSKADIHFERYD
jgi:CDP-4-dehydro-6-deoxyglucose reductase